LGRLPYFAEHLRTRRLIKANGVIDEAQSFQHTGDAQRREFSGEHRLVPGGGNEAHGRQVIDFVRFVLAQDGAQGCLIEQVALGQLNTIPRCSMRP
jgi:hypothetical protein